MRLLFLTAVLAACQSGPSGPVTESGSLEAGDLTLASGEFYDSYTVWADEGQWIRVEVVADGFDPYLIVRSPAEEQSEVDDSEEGVTSRTTLSLQANASGRWQAMVTSFAPRESGSYSITYEVTDVAPPPLDTAPAPPPIRV